MPGVDADMVICGMKKTTSIINDDQITACGWTPYDGMVAKGAPVMSLIRGEVVMEEGAVCAREGTGRSINRLD